ncbi:MAG: flagella synthesis protein FlgN [Succinivibrio sp.]
MNTSNRFVFRQDPLPKPKVKPLTEYLEEQKEILDKLEKVIQAEYESLKNKQVENLKPLSELKSDLMVKLQSNDQRIKLHPDVEKLKTEYAGTVVIIRNMMKKCQYRNEINGRLITFCMQSANKLQAVILGFRDVVTRNMTYTAKGHATARGPMRLSVEA